MSHPDPVNETAPDPDSSRAHDGFLTTHWSVVMAAGGAESEASREALAELCRSYWYPLYAYARRRGESDEDARDLTQGFFCSLLERRDLARLSPERGRFRAFLLAALKHYMANERDRDRAQKRGGGRARLSIDYDQADSRWRIEPAHELSPEHVFQRQWALALLARTLEGLRSEYGSAGKLGLFEALEPLLEGEAPGRYAELAQRLDSTPGALKVAAHRLRRRYRERLRAEIAHTVRRPEDVDDEVRELFRILGEGA